MGGMKLVIVVIYNGISLGVCFTFCISRRLILDYRFVNSAGDVLGEEHELRWVWLVLVG